MTLLALLLAADTVIHMTAKKYEFTPQTVTLKQGVPVVLEIQSLDRKHGFKLEQFGVDEEISPGKPTRIRIVPDKAGTFEFHCDIFCGSGHEDMSGQIVVTP